MKVHMAKREVRYDWWCVRCRVGYLSQDVEASNEAHEPLCNCCGVALIDDIVARREWYEDYCRRKRPEPEDGSVYRNTDTDTPRVYRGGEWRDAKESVD